MAYHSSELLLQRGSPSDERDRASRDLRKGLPGVAVQELRGGLGQHSIVQMKKKD